MHEYIRQLKQDTHFCIKIHDTPLQFYVKTAGYSLSMARLRCEPP